MRLKEVTICGFRGFNVQQTQTLDKNIVLIKGSNGSGKSSFVEALEWLFFDEISRKKKSPCKSEYTGDFLRNIHCKKDQETFVEVLTEMNGKEMKLKKKLLSPEKKEYYINDSFVHDFSSLGITLDEIYKPILSQVETKHYVETDPKDRWEETNRILGLGVLSEFRTNLQELLNAKKNESRYSSLRKAIYGIESDLSAFLELQDLTGALQYRPFSFQTFQKELMQSITQTYQLVPMDIEELGKNLDKQVLRLAQRNENFETIRTLIVPKYHIAVYSSKLLECFKKLLNSMSKIRTTNVELHNFLELGKKLVSNLTCPFCLEETLTPKKLRLIDTRIEETEEAVQLLLNMDSRLKEIRKLKEDMILGTTVFPNKFAVERVRERIVQNPEYRIEVEEIDETTKQIEATDETIRILDSYLESLLQEAELVKEGKKEFDETDFKTKIGVLERHVETAEKASNKLKDDLSMLLGALMSKTPALSMKEKAELNKALLFRKMIDHLNDIKYVGVYENNLNHVTNLIEEIEKFEKAKSENLLANLSGQIKDFYRKLNPSEKIQFSRIIPTKGKSRRIQIKAVSFGKSMNPVSCFSESHMNCLCLSIYFSQRVLNNPYWKFLMLDDPIQTMDEHHAKNLIRILADIAKEKQVIVLSYDSKFCQDFMDLFYGVDYLFYEFSGYSENGPRIDLKQAPFDTYIGIVRKYQDGNMEERAIAANNLRKAIERFTLDLLVQKGKMGRGRASDLKLDERLEKIETANLLTLREIGEIKVALNTCDAGSHEPPRREVTPTELSDGTIAMVNLVSKYLK
jgi:energy-coupling factor transporter ATP-binding protein EcfA2